eukprot:12764926-Alexandrium_andersonii.AAC.1
MPFLQSVWSMLGLRLCACIQTPLRVVPEVFGPRSSKMTFWQTLERLSVVARDPIVQRKRLLLVLGLEAALEVAHRR